jgi:hypothetical protein
MKRLTTLLFLFTIGSMFCANAQQVRQQDSRDSTIKNLTDLLIRNSKTGHSYKKTVQKKVLAPPVKTDSLTAVQTHTNPTNQSNGGGIVINGTFNGNIYTGVPPTDGVATKKTTVVFSPPQNEEESTSEKSEDLAADSGQIRRTEAYVNHCKRYLSAPGNVRYDYKDFEPEPPRTISPLIVGKERRTQKRLLRRKRACKNFYVQQAFQLSEYLLNVDSATLSVAFPNVINIEGGGVILIERMNDTRVKTTEDNLTTLQGPSVGYWSVDFLYGSATRDIKKDTRVFYSNKKGKKIQQPSA